MLAIRINGTTFDGFTEATSSKSMNALCGTFEFKAGGDLTYSKLKELGLAITKDTIVEILADDIKIMTAYIEQQHISYTDTQYSISFSGRDITCDIVDCRISASFTHTASTSLLGLVSSVFAKENLFYNIVDKAVISSVIPFSANDFQLGSNGEAVIDFLNKYALKKYVMLLTDENGNFVMANSGTGASEVSTYKIHNELGVENNIWKASVNYDHTKLYNTYSYMSIPDYTDITTRDQSPQDQSQVSYTSSPDNNIRIGRNFVSVESESYSIEKLKHRCAWKMENQIAKSRNYNVTLDGHSFLNDSNEKIILKINQLVNVVDNTCGINEIMLVESLTYNMNQNGNTLDVVFVQENAYNLRAEDEILSNPYYGTAS